MPTIQINPRLWQLTGGIRIDEDRHLNLGETLEVELDEWTDELSDRKSVMNSNRHRSFVIADEPAPDPEPVWVRAERLLELSAADLKQLAADRDLATGGSKPELADRIRAFELAKAAEADAESA